MKIFLLILLKMLFVAPETKADQPNTYSRINSTISKTKRVEIFRSLIRAKVLMIMVINNWAPLISQMLTWRSHSKVICQMWAPSRILTHHSVLTQPQIHILSFQACQSQVWIHHRWPLRHQPYLLDILMGSFQRILDFHTTMARSLWIRCQHLDRLKDAVVARKKGMSSS